MSEVFFNGVAGRIEGRYHQASAINVPIALVLHPHPLHGGTMNNKVTYAAYKTFVDNNFTVLRINFRGVGRSQGAFDNGVGELIDAATALDWLQLNNPSSSSIWIAGFSFGSWIGMQLVMRRPEVNEFISIAPPLNKYDFSFLSPCPISGLVIHGTNDSVVEEAEVVNFVDWIAQQQCAQISYRTIYGADHFFRNNIDELEKLIEEYLQNTTAQYSNNLVTKNKKMRNDKKWKDALILDE